MAAVAKAAEDATNSRLAEVEARRALNAHEVQAAPAGHGEAAPAGGHGAAPAEHHHSHTLPLDILLFLFICCFSGQLMKQFSGWSGVPYTSLITMFGVVCGILTELYGMGRIGAAIIEYSGISAHLLLFLFLPALIFESAFNSDWHIFKIELGQILIMAGPMLLGSTVLSAVMMTYVFGYGGEFTWTASLMYGSIISATDPVAVVALLKELGASKRLSTMIEGESLMNDGTAMVVFLIIVDFVEGGNPTVSDMFFKFVRLSGGGPVLGVIGGVIMSNLLKRIHNNFVLEVNTTIFVSYFIFFTAESTGLGASGILAVVVLGLYMSNTGKTAISPESEHALHHVWGYVGFVAETVIFIISGIIMGQRSMQDDNLIHYMDYIKLLGIYIGLHFIRFFMILVCWPALRVIGYGMSFEQVVLGAYAGLRGAVGLSLALMVTSSEKIPRYVQDVVLLHVAGVALLTLLINATTTAPLVQALGLSPYSDLKKNILYSLTVNLDKQVEENINKLKSQKQHNFNLVDFAQLQDEVKMHDLKKSLQQYANLNLLGAGDVQQGRTGRLAALNQRINQTGKGADDPEGNDYGRATSALPVYAAHANTPKDDEGSGSLSEAADFSNIGTGAGTVQYDDLIFELRHKFVSILKSLYWEFFEEAQCTANTVSILIESADRGLDDASQELNDWEFINSYVINDSYLDFLEGLAKNPYYGKMFKKQLFKHYSTAYDIIVNFIDAHEEACHMIANVIENKNFVDKILNESNKMRSKAEHYVNIHIVEQFPEIAKAIQTRRAKYYLLIKEQHYVDAMLKTGQIEEKEKDTLTGEIDKMLLALQHDEPEITLMNQSQKIQYYSELSDIFDREDLKTAFDKHQWKDAIYNAKETVVKKGQLSGQIFYVARGTCIEKDGEYEDPTVMQLKYSRGQIACLQNLLPRSDQVPSPGFLYALNSGHASATPLDCDHLKYVLLQDESKLLKLWEHLSHRLLIIHSRALSKKIKQMTVEKMKQFCKMCKVEIHYDGEAVDITHGGVMLRGGLSKMTREEKRKHKIDEKSALDISYNNIYQQERSTNVSIVERKRTIKELAELAKTHGNAKPQASGADFMGIQFIAPRNERDGKKMLISRSEDYTIILSFGDDIAERLLKGDTGGKVTPALVDNAYLEYRNRELKSATAVEHFKMPEGLDALQPGMTFQVKKKPGEGFDFDLVPGHKQNLDDSVLSRSEAKSQTLRAKKNSQLDAEYNRSVRGSQNPSKDEAASSCPQKEVHIATQGTYRDASNRNLITQNDEQALEMAATPSRKQKPASPVRGQAASYVGESDISIHDEGSVAQNNGRIN